MKALLLAATSSLALTGFAMAQTATDSATNPAATGADSSGSMATGTDAGATTGAATGTTMDATTGAAGGAATGGSDAAGGAMGGTGTDAATGATDTTGSATSGDMATGTDAGTATTGAATTDMSTTGTATDTTGSTTVTTAPAADATATTTTDVTSTDAGTAVTSTTVGTMPTADNPGMLGSWVMNRRIWTTNQPSSTAWPDATLTERPAEWTDIAKVDDIVIDADGNIVGYVADIGGFLGLGAKQVLLNPDALHFVQIGDDAFFATNFTREELEALPDFDTTTVMR